MDDELREKLLRRLTITEGKRDFDDSSLLTDTPKSNSSSPKSIGSLNSRMQGSPFWPLQQSPQGRARLSGSISCVEEVTKDGVKPEAAEEAGCAFQEPKGTPSEEDPVTELTKEHSPPEMEFSSGDRDPVRSSSVSTKVGECVSEAFDASEAFGVDELSVKGGSDALHDFEGNPVPCIHFGFRCSDGSVRPVILEKRPLGFKFSRRRHIVTVVKPGGQAELHGVTKGMVLVAVDGKDVTESSGEEVRQLLTSIELPWAA